MLGKNPRNNLSNDTTTAEIYEYYFTHDLEEIEKDMRKKLSQEFSKTRSWNLEEAISKLDYFF